MSHPTVKFILFGIFLCVLLFVPEVEAQKPTAKNSDKPQKLYSDNNILRVKYSPDGKIFALSDSKGTLKLFDTQTWKVLRVLQHPDGAYEPVFSPDSKILVTTTGELADGGMRREKIWFWDVETGKNLYVQDEGDVKHPISAMAFSPDGKTMAWGNSIGRIRLIDVEDLENIKEINDQLSDKLLSITSIKFSPDNSLLAIGSISGARVKVYEVKTGKEVFSYNFKNSNLIIVYKVAFSPDGKTLAIAGRLAKENDWDFTVRLFNTDTWEMTADMRDQMGSIGVEFTLDGKMLVAVGEDKIDVIDLLTKKSIETIKTRNFLSGSSSLSPDGKSIAVDGEDDFVRIFSLASLSN